jgi:glycosyltransferase involved in cell wall biosynthesis
MTNGPCPSVLLVTPSFNQARYLRTTIESVLSQDYPNLRYIVMDGGSTDGSVDIIKEYADRLTYWESGPDGGQTAAIRRGFEIGGGEIINWINSDDYLEPGALRRVAELAAKHPDAAMLAFPVRNFTNTQDGEQDINVSIPSSIALPNMLLARRPRARRHQPGIFLRRTAYETAGGLNPALHIAMDYDLHLRMLGDGGTVAYGDAIVANFRKHADAKTASARNAIVFVCEVADSAEAVYKRTGHTASFRPLAPVIASALLAAIRNRSHHDAADALRAATRIGWGSMITGSATFVFRRYVLGRRDELP